jgi:hypothetical protein
MQTQIVAALLRHALTAAGVAGVLEGDSLIQVASALVTLATVAWSIVQKVRSK